MILTCPECASRYFVDDARVGPRGRSVRCASCGHSWRAMPQATAFDADRPLALTAEASVPHYPGDAALEEPLRAPPLPERIRAEAMEKKKTRQAIAAGVAWAALGAGFIALAIAAVLFRVDVVRLWPQTASAYALARMPVNPTGLALDNVQGQSNLINGHAALSVTASERNVETRPRASMPLRVILYDKSGRRLTSAVSAPPTVLIAAGGVRPFAVNFIDPPAELSNFVVEFAFDKTPKSAPAPPAAKPPLKRLAGPPTAPPSPSLQPVVAPLSAQDAKSLPSDSPYALPPSAIQQTH